MSGALRLAAPAKLNLSLAVVGRRPNGWHELVGTVVLLDLADELRLGDGTPGLNLEVDPGSDVSAAELPADTEHNLAWRGLLAGAADAEPGMLHLRKRIPIGAGLGGGSSDAAAAWRLVRHRAGQRAAPTPDELRGLAAIGADVPFFAVAAPAAYVRGVGEVVEPIDAPEEPVHVVLVLPPFRLATAAVFGALRESDWSAPGPPSLLPGRNDLLAAARRLRPELDTVFAEVRAAGGHPHLTGSGSTVYAVADDVQHAAAMIGTLRERGLRAMHHRLARRAASIAPVLDDQRQEP